MILRGGPAIRQNEMQKESVSLNLLFYPVYLNICSKSIQMVSNTIAYGSL